jgi:hypothetical protein
MGPMDGTLKTGKSENADVVLELKVQKAMILRWVPTNLKSMQVKFWKIIRTF